MMVMLLYFYKKVSELIDFYRLKKMFPHPFICISFEEGNECFDIIFEGWRQDYSLVENLPNFFFKRNLTYSNLSYPNLT